MEVFIFWGHINPGDFLLRTRFYPTFDLPMLYLLSVLNDHDLNDTYVSIGDDHNV